MENVVHLSETKKSFDFSQNAKKVADVWTAATSSVAYSSYNDVLLTELRFKSERAVGSVEHVTGAIAGVVSAVEELSASASSITANLDSSKDITSEAVRMASGAEERIVSLTEAAERIGTVLNLISSIAGQTNLLALNATIEAARAGEAGKGFAVVAGEVKSLAKQTAEATEEISHQIASIQSAVKETAQAITDINSVIQKTDEASRAIAEAVSEQQAATNEIGTTSSGIVDIADELAGDMQQISTNLKEIADEGTKLSNRVTNVATDLYVDIAG